MDAFLTTQQSRILLYSFFLVFPQTVAGILDKYPVGMEYRELLTCENKCGLTTDVCSCNVRCLIFGNCCEDFKWLCDLDDEEKTFIERYKNSSVICYRGRYFMIDIDEFAEDENYTPMPSSTAVYPTINELLSNIPISDLYTNLTYRNHYVFSLYAQNYSQPVMWEAEVDVDIPDASTDQQEYERWLVRNTSTTILMEFKIPKHQNLGYDACLGDDIAQCVEPLRDPVQKELASRCQDFTSYVAVKSMSGSYTYYRNIYCYRCNGGRGFDFTIALPRRRGDKTPSFASLMTITDSLIILDAKNDPGVMWKTITCSRDVSHLLSFNDFKCNDYTLTCKDHTVKTADNKCKLETNLRIAIPYGRVNPRARNIVTSLFSCLLRNQFPGNLIDENQERIENREAFVIFDPRMNILLNSIYLNVFWTDDLSNIEDLRIIKFIELMNRAYKKHSTTFENAGQALRGDGIPVKVEQFNLITSIFKSEVTFKMTDLLQGSNFANDFVSNDKDSNLITCLCLQDRGEDIDPCSLGCWHASEASENDKDVENLLASSCFRLFDTSILPTSLLSTAPMNIKNVPKSTTKTTSIMNIMTYSKADLISPKFFSQWIFEQILLVIFWGIF